MNDNEKWSPAVVTAVVGGLVTVVCAILQFIVAPIVISSHRDVSLPLTPGLQMSPQAPTTNGGTPKQVHASVISVPPRIDQMLASDPSGMLKIDESLVTRLGTERLTASDVEALTCWQLRVLRNIRPAIHGHQFKDLTLANLFKAQPWYQRNSETALNAVEDANITVIQRVETLKGCLNGS